MISGSESIETNTKSRGRTIRRIGALISALRVSWYSRIWLVSTIIAIVGFGLIAGRTAERVRWFEKNGAEMDRVWTTKYDTMAPPALSFVNSAANGTASVSCVSYDGLHTFTPNTTWCSKKPGVTPGSCVGFNFAEGGFIWTRQKTLNASGIGPSNTNQINCSVTLDAPALSTNPMLLLWLNANVKSATGYDYVRTPAYTQILFQLQQFIVNGEQRWDTPQVEPFDLSIVTNGTMISSIVYISPISFRTQHVDGSLPVYSRWQAFVDCGGAAMMIAILHCVWMFLVGLFFDKPALISRHSSENSLSPLKQTIDQ